MPGATLPSLPVLSGGQTAAGNYFVANYPPFSFWSPDRAADVHAALDRAPAPGADLGLYVHVPFCRKRCHFCYFKVYTNRNHEQIGRYIQAVLRESRCYADRPFVAGRRPGFVYFGGGTPSYLSVAQLQRLVDGLQSVWPWTNAEEVAFEAEPGTLNESKLRALKALGVTRLSLGIESFNPDILRANNRAHGAAEIDRAYAAAREVGFAQINIDLIAGMLNETDATWTDGVRKAVALQPDSITIYQMEIPYNTTIYQRMKAAGEVTAPVADWPTKRRWTAEAFAAFESAGYTVASAYTAVRDPARTEFLYRDRLWTGADLVGLGVSSFSHVGGTHFQNEHDIDRYVAAVESGRLPLRRALTMTAEERLVRELILQLKLGRVSLSYFREKFGVDLTERFAGPLGACRDAGALAVADGQVRLTRDALLQVDALLPAFFLPQHQHARYA